MASKELQVLFLLLWLWFLGQKNEVRAQFDRVEGGTKIPDSANNGTWWNNTVRDSTLQILMSPNGNFGFNLSFTNQSRSSCAAVVFRNTWNIATWVGNFNTTVVDSNTNTNCTLNFSASAGLVLSSGSNETIWSTEHVLKNQSDPTSLHLDNDGCLFIKNSTGGNWLWNSCDYPSDTLVTKQADYENDLFMAAALSNYEYSTGNDFFMHTNDSKDSKDLILSQTISYNGSSFLQPYQTISNWSSTLTNSIDNGTWDYVRLQPNGSLVFKKTSSNVTYPFFNDNCDISGACGAFGICLQGFKTSNLSTAVNFTCEGLASSSSGCLEDHQFVNVTGRTYLDPQRFNEKEDINASSCLSRCRSAPNCTCTNALHLIRNVLSRTGPCLLNLASVLTIRNDSDLQTLFLRVPSAPAPAPTSSTRKSAAIGFAGGAAALLFLLLAGSTLWLFLKRRKLDDDYVDTGKPDPPYEPAKLPPQYSYKELEESTGSFNRRLGYGRSSVYAGQNKTAIKVLGEEIEEKAFLAAVATMASLSHPNLVPLQGFCCVGRHKMLVYELVDEGQSLNSYLFRKDSTLLMNVQHRRMIALEAARGLAYLHESQIIHGGVKPENIMIDSEMSIRLVDYGLVSLTSTHQKLITATDRGSRAYMAPEWSKFLPVTPKVDVYSFGVVLLELVSGRSCWTQSGVSEERRFLPTWGFAVLGKGPDHLLEIADPRLDAQALSEEDKQVLRGMIFVALWCVQEDPSNRYPMSDVVDMLNGDVAVDPPPPSPGLDALATELYAIHGNNEPRTDSHR